MFDFFARFKRQGGSVTVNGKTYQGSNVSICNGRVMVDGKEVSDESRSPVINVSVQGDVESLKTGSGDVSVSGSVGHVQTGSGDVECAEVRGSVTTGSGDVSAGNVYGSVSSKSGDVSYRR